MGDDDLQRFITGMEPPPFQLGGFYQPKDGPPNNRRRRQREVWKEFAAPLNSAGPAEVHQVWRSLQEMEERLSDRYDELRQKSERLENRAKVYQLFAQLLAMKAREHGEQTGESKIREAEEENFHVKPDGPFTWKVEAGKSPQLVVRPSKEKLEQVGIDPEAVPPHHRARSFSGEETWNAAVKRLHQLTRPVKDHQDDLQRTAGLARFRRGVLENVLYQFEVFGQVQEKLPEGDLQQVDELAAKQPQPGRDSILNDPTAYPSKTLNAVLEWTSDNANKPKPFRSECNPSLCGFVSEQLADEEAAGWKIPEDTIKTRLRSLMDELDVELPHGPTNKLSYFEARGQIVEAMQARDLRIVEI
jgi:hypothetical protein